MLRRVGVLLRLAVAVDNDADFLQRDQPFVYELVEVGQELGNPFGFVHDLNHHPTSPVTAPRLRPFWLRRLPAKASSMLPLA